MRKPSPETELRTLRREVKRLLSYRLDAEQTMAIQRGQITKAQQETAEWKRRFDALLERTPKDQG